MIWNLAIFLLVTFALGVRWLFMIWRWSRERWLVGVCALVVGAFAWGGTLLIDWAGRMERERFEGALAPWAPTYSFQLQELGHGALAEDAQATGAPLYRRISTTLRHWQETNAKIRDIYTLRRAADGKIRVVASSRTSEEPSAAVGSAERPVSLAAPEPGHFLADPPLSLEMAFVGGTSFHSEAAGQFSDMPALVSAFTPLRNAEGTIEAVVGVNFDASEGAQSVGLARWAVTGLLLATVAGFFSTVILAFIASERRLRREEKEAAAIVSAERNRFESLVNSLNSAVWELDVPAQKWTFMSAQVERLTGYAPTAWTEEFNFLEKYMDSEDAAALQRCRQAALLTGRAQQMEVKIRHASGREVWLQETCNAVRRDGRAEFLRGLWTDITAQKESQQQLEEVQRQIVVASRQSGMAEIATGVLHNVGNVLNSVNVASQLVDTIVRQSRVGRVAEVAALMQSQEDLGGFFQSDPRAKLIPDYLASLAKTLHDEHGQLRGELRQIEQNIGHIREIVNVQQSYASVGGYSEAVDLAALVEDSIHLNATAFGRHAIAVERRFADLPPIRTDKHKILQILVNLLRNAKQALDEVPVDRRRLNISIVPQGGDRVCIVVQDNGVGIAAENLTRIFSFGFTTKKTGHGFGLHHSAIAARELGGSLTAQSAGVGSGATFILELPFTPQAPEPAAPVPAFTFSPQLS